MGATPRFKLVLGGLQSETDRPEGGPWSFVVDRSLDLPADGLRVMLASRGQVAPGDGAQLDLGDEDGLERVFTGTVVEIRPRADGAEIFAAGTVLKLLDLRVSSLYQEQTAGAVARDLVDRAGLDSGEISEGLTLPRFAVDRRRSAFSQLKALATRLGFDLFADREGKVHFRGLGEAAGPGAGLAGGLGSGALAFGSHLVDARGLAGQPPGRKVVVGGESPMSGQGEDKSFWLTAKDTDFEDSAGDGEELLVLDPLARTKDMAGHFAQGYHTHLSRRGRSVRVTVLGQAALDLGDPLSTVDAPEDLLNASGFVRALRHRFVSGQGFLTSATICVEGGA